MNLVKIIHTSDLHLGASFRNFKDNAKQHTNNLRQALRATIQDHLNNDAQLMIIAGDLFDSPQPTQQTIDFVIATFEMTDKPIVILPGNHDYYYDKSVYHRTQFPAHVFVFDDTKTSYEFKELDLTVHANTTTSKDSKKSPLSDLRPNESTKWNVAVAHGNLEMPNIDNPTRAIRMDDIQDSEMNYVALGDWHSLRDCSAKSVKAYYCGSPEPTSIDHQKSGYFIKVELKESDINIKPIKIGAIENKHIEVQIIGKTQQSIIDEINQYANDKMILKVRLQGDQSLETLLDTDLIVRNCSSNFYCFKLDDKTITHDFENAFDKIGDYPDGHAISIFLNLAHEKYKNEIDEGKKAQIFHAAQHGLALLQGKKLSL